MVLKVIHSIKAHGVKATLIKIRERLRRKHPLLSVPVQAQLTPEELESQRNTVFPRRITFSIITPLYNTPLNYLREMLASVCAQTYADWELCLADGSDAAHRDVGAAVKQYAKQDKRIRYIKLSENNGIAGNTNACINMAAGEYIAFLDHDDLLTADALYENMKVICGEGADFIFSDEDKTDETASRFFEPHFKPGFSPDYLRSNNYICHLAVVSKEVADKIGLLDTAYNGAQDFDFVLRATEKAEKICHIPKILYHWRIHAASTASDIANKAYAIDAGRRAIDAHLTRMNLAGNAEETKYPGWCRVRYALLSKPLVSIVIPSKDHTADLSACLRSIQTKSTYENFEIIVAENNSEDPKTFAFYDKIKDARVRVIRYEGPFNFSKINNFAAGHANGEYLLFLNNDTEVLSPGWLEEMLMYAQRPDVGAVGAKLCYKDLTVQHAGVVVTALKDSAAHHVFVGTHKDYHGYFGRLAVAQNYSAVTGACLMTAKRVFKKLNGFDESLAVNFNDIDYCLRAIDEGLRVVWTPFAELFHYESKSRGSGDTERLFKESAAFSEKWVKYAETGDPFYNPNFDPSKGYNFEY